MIDFRYHLVSIVAIFLSLAVGLVLGATTLQSPVLSSLEREVSSTTRSNEDLRKRERELLARIEGEEKFTGSLAPQIVADRLKDQHVVLIETPGAGDQSLAQLSDLVGKAGATVTGTVTVQKKFLDDDQMSVLSELSDGVRPDDVTFAADAGPYDKAGAVLAAALVTRDAARGGRADDAGTEILDAFKKAGFVTTGEKFAQHATLALVIAPSTPYSYKGADIDGEALISLTSALDAGGRGGVLAGPPTAAREGGLIAALRDSAAGDKVSSVDTADTPAGQVVTVLALQSEVGGRSGRYGTGPDAAGFLPSPVPTVGDAG